MLPRPMNAACACATRNSFLAVVIFLALAVVASGCGGPPLPTPAGPVDVSPGQPTATLAPGGQTPTLQTPAGQTPGAETPGGEQADPRACNGAIVGRAVEEVEVAA
jgi:hypothetical protein